MATMGRDHGCPMCILRHGKAGFATVDVSRVVRERSRENNMPGRFSANPSTMEGSQRPRCRRPRGDPSQAPRTIFCLSGSISASDSSRRSLHSPSAYGPDDAIGPVSVNYFFPKNAHPFAKIAKSAPRKTSSAASPSWSATTVSPPESVWIVYSPPNPLKLRTLSKPTNSG